MTSINCGECFHSVRVWHWRRRQTEIRVYVISIYVHEMIIIINMFKGVVAVEQTYVQTKSSAWWAAFIRSMLLGYDDRINLCSKHNLERAMSTRTPLSCKSVLHSRASHISCVFTCCPCTHFDTLRFFFLPWMETQKVLSKKEFESNVLPALPLSDFNLLGLEQ